jgi:hypothetical protein
VSPPGKTALVTCNLPSGDVTGVNVVVLVVVVVLVLVIVDDVVVFVVELV